MASENVLADKNVTTLALEVPISCLVNGDPVIGAWTTASTGRHALGGSVVAGRARRAPVRPAESDFVPTQDCNGWVPDPSVGATAPHHYDP